MNNEIKEIKHRLELLHAECNPKAREEDINYTLDYITNLQQENERLKEIIGDYVNVVLHDRKVIDDYNSCCEKAIELLHNLNDTLPLDLILSEIEHSENILQNGSDEE